MDTVTERQDRPAGRATTRPTSRRTARATRARVIALVAVAAALVVVAAVTWRVLSEDPKVPYDDPQSAGLLTLCSVDGEAVTGGAVGDRPFADVVLGETGLPPEYVPDGTVATLFAYQPREGIAAGEFSGTPLTAAGVTSPDSPAVAVTEDAWTVGDFTTAFPATYDGFVQLRLYLGTPDAGTLTEIPYDTADLRVDGGRWELVRGGSASCADAAALVP